MVGILDLQVSAGFGRVGTRLAGISLPGKHIAGPVSMRRRARPGWNRCRRNVKLRASKRGMTGLAVPGRAHTRDPRTMRNLEPERPHFVHQSRRGFLQVGYSGLLGMGLPGLLAARAAAAPGGQPSGGRGR